MAQNMMTIDNCKVFYDSWQLECCGPPFALGDTVKWLVLEIGKDDLNTPVDMGKVDYCYEAHSSAWQELFVLQGRVEKIQTLYQKYEPHKDNPKMLIPIGGKLIGSQEAQGFEKNIDGLKATGCLVNICDYTVRPAKQEEVTFR